MEDTKMSRNAEHVIIPKDYKSPLSVIETEKAIKLLKDFSRMSLLRSSIL